MKSSILNRQGTAFFVLGIMENNGSVDLRLLPHSVFSSESR